MKSVKRIAITGAAGQIAYSLVFRIAAGEMLGHDQPVILHLLDITPTLPALQGVRMELEDCAYPLLHGIVVTDQPDIAFAACDYALLVGAKPRSPGMERKDLLELNAPIFYQQGRSLNACAQRTVKILVVGNPANTNAWITRQAAPDLEDHCFSAMTRLDHNRALSLLARQAQVGVEDIRQLAVWGNHSTLQYPCLQHALIQGQPALERVDPQWVRQTFIPTIQQRGAVILQARGKSSAASAALAILDHVHDWALGNPLNDWVSMAIPSDGSYGITSGLIYSYPVTLKNGAYHLVPNLPLDDFSRDHLRANEQELMNERDVVRLRN